MTNADFRAAINIGTNINSWVRVKGWQIIEFQAPLECRPVAGHTSHLNLSHKEMMAASQQMTSVFGSLDGSFGFVRPISEKSFRSAILFFQLIAMHCCRRLHFLQQFISTAVPQVAGLNPKVCVGSLSAFLHALLPIGLLVCLQGARAARPLRPTINAHNPRHMVDGDVVERFLHLSTADKQELARRLGASRSVAHHQSFRSSISNS